MKLLYDFLFLPIFRICDFFYPKKDNYWAFCVHHIKSDQFIENQRALFEYVKKMEHIKKIIFHRSCEDVDFQLDGEKNVEIVRIGTLRAFFLLMQCRVIFLGHSISMDYSIRYGKKLFSVVKLRLSSRIVVNLWHGIAIKRLLNLTHKNVRKMTDRVAYNRIERANYGGLVCSSDIDSYAMYAMFSPISHESIWLTGLPRNDFLLQDEKLLPRYFEKSLLKIRNLKKQKRLIVYAPTYRQSHFIEGASYYQFSPSEIEKLRNLLHKHQAILGFRMHYFRNSDTLCNLDDYIDGVDFIDIGHSEIPEIGAVIRECDIMITDYSSVYIDALYVQKPVFCFAYDLKEYKENQDGLLYDIDLAFPSKVATCFEELSILLEDELSFPEQIISDSYQKTRKLFFKFIDTNNSDRVVQKIEEKMKGKIL